MNGAESLVRTLVAGGVDVCFTNPGTSEMHFVAALDRVEGMRCVLGLFEGVVTGAADGYFRMKGRRPRRCCISAPASPTALPICTTPRRPHSGIVNIVGQHATYHIDYNAPLTSDIEGLARPMSAWVRTSPDAKSVAADGAAAIAAAKSCAAADRHPDPACRHRLERGRRHRRGARDSQRAELFAAGGRDRGAGCCAAAARTLLLLTGGALTEQGLALAAADRRQDRLQGDGPDLSIRGWRAGAGASRSTAFPM